MWAMRPELWWRYMSITWTAACNDEVGKIAPHLNLKEHITVCGVGRRKRLTHSIREHHEIYHSVSSSLLRNAHLLCFVRHSIDKLNSWLPNLEGKTCRWWIANAINTEKGWWYHSTEKFSCLTNLKHRTSASSTCTLNLSFGSRWV